VRQPFYKAYIGRVGSKLKKIYRSPITWPNACFNGCKYSIIIKNITSFGRMQISAVAGLPGFWLSILECVPYLVGSEGQAPGCWMLDFRCWKQKGAMG